MKMRSRHLPSIGLDEKGNDRLYALRSVAEIFPPGPRRNERQLPGRFRRVPVEPASHDAVHVGIRDVTGLGAAQGIVEPASPTAAQRIGELSPSLERVASVDGVNQLSEMPNGMALAKEFVPDEPCGI